MLMVRRASTRRTSRDLLTCVCNAVNQCPTEAADYYRMIIWEGLSYTWNLIRCNSRVGSPPTCETGTTSTIPGTLVTTITDQITTIGTSTVSPVITRGITTPLFTTTRGITIPLFTTTSSDPRRRMGGK